MDKPKILYIEDNPENRLLVRRVLDSDGFAVVTAGDGLSGIRAARIEKPDLILMDIMIPGMDGREVTTRLRGIPGLENVPIVAVTASVMRGDRERALAAGCDGYLQKPIDVDRLPDQVRQFLVGRREGLALEDEIIFLRYQNQRLAARLEEKLERLSSVDAANKRLADLSLTDELTGLANRRYLDRRLREELRMARRFRTPLACVLIDLDQFNQINDSQGQPIGDQVLLAIGEILSASRREFKIVGRYRDDEFLVILPQIDAPPAVEFAECLRRKIEGTALTLGPPQPVRLTVSIGIAHCRCDQDMAAEEMMRQAGAALNQAKSAGRNRSVLFTSASGERLQ